MDKVLTVNIPLGHSRRATEEVPRFMYHLPPRGRRRADGSLVAYKIREGEAADAFGRYVWLSREPTASGAYMVDLTKLSLINLRSTGQTEGQVLHRGDIPYWAIVRRVK